MLSDKDITTEKRVFLFKSPQHSVGKVLLQWFDEKEDTFTQNFMTLQDRDHGCYLEEVISGMSPEKQGAVSKRKWGRLKLCMKKGQQLETE